MKKLMFAIVFLLLTNVNAYARDFSGSWQVVANGYLMVLNITQDGSSITGTFDTYNPGETTPYHTGEITGDVDDEIITFTRWLGSQYQQYQGIYLSNGISGKFSANGSSNYPWSWTAVKKP